MMGNSNELDESCASDEEVHARQIIVDRGNHQAIPGPDHSRRHQSCILIGR